MKKKAGTKKAPEKKKTEIIKKDFDAGRGLLALGK